MKKIIWLQFFILMDCSTDQNKDVAFNKTQTTVDSTIFYRGTGELIKINFNDPFFIDKEFYAKDTITPNGWKIEYFVKDDSTIHTDLYIKWSKGKIEEIYVDEHVLLMRDYFIPKFEAETADYLYLQHDCATGCSAYLVLSKKDSWYKDFVYIIDLDIKTQRIVYIPQSSYGLDSLELAVTDLKKRLEKKVLFTYKCDLAPEDGCIDSVSFKRNSVVIFFSNTNSLVNTFHEKKIARFD